MIKFIKSDLLYNCTKYLLHVVVSSYIADRLLFSDGVPRMDKSVRGSCCLLELAGSAQIKLNLAIGFDSDHTYSIRTYVCA